MQNKQALIGIVAALVILLGAGGVFLYGQNKTSPQPNSTTATENVNENSSINSDIASILKSGKTQQCTFSSEEVEGESTQGMVYITGDKLRTDLTITSNGKTSDVYVIRNGNENYIWGSEFPDNTGMKMTMSLDEYETNSDSKKYFDPTRKVDYSCSGWTVDSSVFAPPTDIKFQDPSSMMEEIIQAVSKTPTGAAGVSSQCSICNSLTGEAKNACAKQFNC